ncbi:hypothetical protein ACFYO9_31300 [Streptomyces sp. NPDC005863]|uniref:hypothetical protein n=1 Tax=unclassified Streptomyces TaxID=2593676 RepID=UPI0033E00DDD
MTNGHEAVRVLLGARAVDALTPGDAAGIASHLGGCAPCAAEAERLRAAVRHLDGPAVPDPAPGATPAAHGLSLALRTRAPALRTAPHAAPYAAAVAGLQVLLAESDGRGAWDAPVGHGRNVHDTLARLIAADEPLAHHLGPAPRSRTAVSRAPDAAPWRAVREARAREVVRRERARTPAQTVSTWRVQAAGLLSTRAAHDTERAARATVLGGVRLPVADHFLARALDTWAHADGIGAALGLPVPSPPAPHLWQLVRLGIRLLGPALGPQAPPVALTVAGEGGETVWVLGSAEDPVRAELVLDPADFCLLLTGRRTPDRIPRGTSGDTASARRLLSRAASLV